MKTKAISVNSAVPGMIVAEDILTFNNILLIDSGSPLTDRVITRLKFYNIEEITILYDENTHHIENDISVACCGSSLSTYQVQELIDSGAEEIIIAFDR